MKAKERQEFIIMLLIENRSFQQDEKRFYDYLKEHYDLNKFNERYMELLDDFMKSYALNKTEKSEENL
jgi:hypothetical protein